MANEYVVNRADLEAVAEAIRGKSGSSESLTFPNGFTDKINSLEVGGGDTTVEDGLIDGTLSGDYYNDRVTKVRSYGFQSLLITKITLPIVREIDSYSFRYCRSLTEAEFPSVISITTGAFSGCSKLERIIIGSNITSVCALGNQNAFSGTAIVNGTGYIYVPDDLVDQYKVATNWTTYANQIKGISELEG